MTAQLQQFFQLCDPDNSSSVHRDAFRQLCNRFEISDHDADGIFDDLDHDRDGKITFEDFSRGFSDFLISAGMAECESEPNREPDRQTDSLDDSLSKIHEVCPMLAAEEEELEKNSEKEIKLKWLLDELQCSDKKHLVPYLENAVEELLSNLQRLQEENEKLEKSWQREKVEHERHVKRMADEMDSQVKDTEMRLRMKAQAEVEDERKSLQTKMDAEMDNLQAHLALFDKVNSWLQSQPADSYDIRLEEVRNKMNDAVNENRQLRMSLLDTQTSMALMRSELLQLRTLYEEKCRELSSEREKIMEVLHEQDHLSHQLSLLHDANRRLQDTNDALRSSFEHPNNASKVATNCDLKREKSGSIIGDYINAKCSHCQNLSRSNFEDTGSSERLDDSRFLRRAKSVDVFFPPSHRRKHSGEKYISINSNHFPKRAFEAKDYLDHDEGFSSTPDSSLLMKDDDNVFEASSSSPIRQSHMKPVFTSTPEQAPLTKCHSISEDVVLESEVPGDESNVESSKSRLVSCGSEDSLLKEDQQNEDDMPKKKLSDIIKQLGFQDEVIRNYNSKKKSLDDAPEDAAIKPPPVTIHRKSFGLKSPGQTENWTQQKVFNRCNTCAANHDHPLSNMGKTDPSLCNGNCENDQLMTSLDEEALYLPDGPPDKMFNVIFVGDAGVGKSSFALRISKGVFMRHMSATLGVDFLMRTIKIDNCNVELRLWDTAGQERFRSVTTSYFRKADGVMLLYDCTCEQSFLNVRQWVKDIDVTCFYRLMAHDGPPGQKTITAQNIPLMIVGNKIDLRAALQKSGRNFISTELGEKLAKDCGASFAEASAKDGINVMPALISLVRHMLDGHDMHSSQSTMQLSDGKQKKGCCGK